MTQPLPVIIPRSRRIFADTGSYVGIIHQDDQHHKEARRFLQSLAAQRYRHFTTNAILFETHALLLSRVGIPEAGEFLRRIRQSDTVIVRVSAQDEARAEEILFRYTDHDFSFTDASSFAVMERLHVSLAFAFDKHFPEYGFLRYGIDTPTT